MANQNGHGNVTDFRTATLDPAELARNNGILAKRIGVQRAVIRTFSVTLVIPFIFWVGFRLFAFQGLQEDCVKPLHAALNEKTDVQSALVNVERAIAYVDASGGVRHPCTSIFKSSSCGDDDVESWFGSLKDMRDVLKQSLVARAKREKESRDSAPTAAPASTPEEKEANRVKEADRQEAYRVKEAGESVVALENAHRIQHWKNHSTWIGDVPSGLSMYPMNGAGALWGVISSLVAIIAVFMNWILSTLAPGKEEQEVERRSRVKKTPQRVASNVAGAANSNESDEDDDESSGTRRTA